MSVGGLRGFVRETRADVGRLPLAVLVAVCTATTCGVLGGAVGLCLGLAAHPPTAWFAVVEVGLPSAVAGFFVGLVSGAMAQRLRGSSAG